LVDEQIVNQPIKFEEIKVHNKQPPKANTKFSLDEEFPSLPGSKKPIQKEKLEEAFP